MRRFPIAGVLAVALLAARPALPAGVPSADLAAQQIQLQPYRPQSGVAQAPDVARAFSSFARAWSGRDADAVADLVPEDGRASVAIQSRGVSSQMSRTQIEAVLSSLFSEAERAAFDLSTIHHQADETSAWGVGDWVYESRNAELRQRERVFIVLRRDSPGDWVLSELRVQPIR